MIMMVMVMTRRLVVAISRCRAVNAAAMMVRAVTLMINNHHLGRLIRLLIRVVLMMVVMAAVAVTAG